MIVYIFDLFTKSCCTVCIKSFDFFRVLLCSVSQILVLLEASVQLLNMKVAFHRILYHFIIKRLVWYCVSFPLFYMM